ncbi:glycosyltransferase [Metallosphaera yellowstonensis MK1]|uniref:Glycosyltransferase n=1 Tax=Metallosphaera yellowstonensis MK1 TaxID=671065 RepID=H2C0H1_9CREN|nr:glycosyltransferase family 4 protein [Metallosphaera yellowstonensis]EHP71233.1 glycosyltransferase [Metallosphaera yellowstonensis MK1]
MKVSILTETPQRGTFATMLIVYQKLRELGIDSEIFTTFDSEYSVLPSPPRSRIFGMETVINGSYSYNVFDLISPKPKDSILHIANAWHGVIPVANSKNVKTVINIQYWWVTCYFNSMENPDCGCSGFKNISSCIARKRTGLRKLGSPGEAFYAMRKLKKIRENVSKADSIIAVSNIVRNVLVEHNFPEEKIKIININALSPFITYATYEPSDTFTFAYLSYPDEGKGIFQLLRAFHKALKLNPNIRLKVPGGTEEPRVVEEVKTMGLQGKVILTPRLNYEKYVKQVGEFLRDVDVVVVPTLVPDTWARVVTESMLAGRPVMVTKGNGGLVEQVTDGVDGFHVDVYDLEKFAKSIYEVSVIPRDQIRKMGVLARENISNKFNSERIMGDLVSLYRSLLEK